MSVVISKEKEHTKLFTSPGKVIIIKTFICIEFQMTKMLKKVYTMNKQS